LGSGQTALVEELKADRAVLIPPQERSVTLLHRCGGL
jgi:hypothetical protein